MAGKKTITLSFKIDEELNQRIEQCMQEEKRSKSNLVVKILTKYLDETEYAKKLLETRIG